MKKYFFVFAFLFFFVMFAFPKDIYVRVGSSGNGTKDAPYGKLWKAISKAVRGDVIHVAAGTYYGKGGSGNFTIGVPNLTLVGGYNVNFTERNPFKYFTILERAKDYRGGFVGLGEGIIEGSEKKDHSGLIVDGFVLNSETRNAYAPDKSKIIPKKSWKGALFKAYSRNITIKNCILLNPYGNGIYVKWQGDKNEVSNNFIINTFYAAISTRSAQPNSKILIKNNNIVFGWFQPGKGGSYGLFIGKNGKVVVNSNIFAFFQTEGGEAGYAVSNNFGNDFTELKNNIFYQCQGGFYTYLDEDGKNLVVWKKEDFDDLNSDPESYMLEEAGGNKILNPGFKPDKWYFEKFSNFVASKPGKLNMDEMNQIRSILGLPLEASKGSARKNWGMPYPLSKVIPNLVSNKGAGVVVNKKFEEYSSKSTGGENLKYTKVDFEDFSISKRGKTFNGEAVEFFAGIGSNGYDYFLKDASRSDYVCVKFIKPGESSFTRKYVFGYILKGSKAYKKFLKYSKRKDRYNKAGGIKVKGKAYYIGKPSYLYPVGIIIYDLNRH
ncbi:hypothetical protein TTHT_0497 [Thermotomaculum hydrothermale]|uniref:Right handed beta helix domain-containing protein n=1 Tax=Thermotomaculum hydrothermale TaxID=981385 RepID=A0A7R6SY13_9BACT|nr:right-handed parallel beta-helix repeat-containing protein [Thermotomaculum hydrothermale]BBB32086.1 hypothetical protein TTHT_0497 [Thermotomaculum hydrothermale]